MPPAKTVSMEQQLIQKVRKWHYSPFLATIDQAIDYLMQLTTPAPISLFHAVALDRQVAIFTGGEISADDGKQDVDVKNRSHYKVVRVDGILPDEYFVSNVELGEATDQIAKRICSAKQLAPFHGWEMNLLSAGECFTTSLEVPPMAFVSSNKTTSDYFDFVMYQGKHCWNYSTKKHAAKKGIEHSGDIGNLLHVLYAHDPRGLPEEEPLVLAVIGYRSQPLRQFRKQLPAVCIPSPTERVVNVIPCPLDEASVQDHSMACLVVGQRLGTRIDWSVCSVPSCSSGVDTCDKSAKVDKCVADAIEDFQELQKASRERAKRTAGGGSGCGSAAHVDPAAAVPSATTCQPALKENRDEKKNFPTAGLLIFQHSLKQEVVDQWFPDPNAANGAVTAGIGSGVTLFPSKASLLSGSVGGCLLPCVAGPLQGPPLLALGASFAANIPPTAPLHPSASSPGATVDGAAAFYRSLVSDCKVLKVVHVTDAMLEQSVGTATQLLNAIFVVHATQYTPSKAFVEALGSAGSSDTLLASDMVEQELNQINMSAVTSMAGPLSMILVELCGSVYFYRGLVWGCLLHPSSSDSGVPRAQAEEWKFGQNVSSFVNPEAVHKLLQRAVNGELQSALRPSLADTETNTATNSIGSNNNSPPPFSIPPVSLHRQGETTVLFDGEIVPHHEAVVSQIQRITDEATIRKLKLPILEFLAQICVVLDAKQLQRVVTNCILPHVANMLSDRLALLNKELQKVVLGGDPAEIKRKGREIALQKKAAKESLQWLVDAAGKCISVKQATSRKFDLNRMLRKANIASNVNAAKEMTFDDLCDLLDNECHDETGCLIAHCRTQQLFPMIANIANGTFLDNFYAMNNVPVMYVEPRMLFLDACTVGSLKQLDRKGSELHSQADIDAIKSRGLGGGMLDSRANQGDISLAMTGLEGIPSIPMPLLERYVNLKDASSVLWVEECNHPTVAKLRILLRTTISSCAAGRDLALPPTKKEIGHAIVMMLFQSMQSTIQQNEAEAGEEEQSSGASASQRGHPLNRLPPPPTDLKDHFDDTRSMILRGLFGLLLTTLASGSNPLSMAWQLTGPYPNIECPSMDSWWIYGNLIRYFPYTCWPREKIARNAAILCVRLLRKFVVDPLTNPMRKAIAADLRAAQEGAFAAREEELKFLEVATEVVFLLAEKDTQERDLIIKEVSERMLSVAPHPPTKNQNDGYSHLYEFFVLGRKGACSWEGSPFRHTLEVAANIVVKRSALFAPHKKQLLAAAQEGGGKLFRGEIRKLVATVQHLEGRTVPAEEQAAIQSAPSEPPKIKIQNRDAIKAMDAGRMAGDAELYRVPWELQTSTSKKKERQEGQTEQPVVVGYEPSLHTQNTILFVMGQPLKSAPPVATTAAATTTQTAEAKPASEADGSADDRYSQLRARLEESSAVPSKALALASKLRTITVSQVLGAVDGPLQEEFTTFLSMGVAGHNSSNSDKKPFSEGVVGNLMDNAVREVLFELLFHWRDTVLGESMAMESAFGMSSVSSDLVARMQEENREQEKWKEQDKESQGRALPPAARSE